MKPPVGGLSHKELHGSGSALNTGGPGERTHSMHTPSAESGGSISSVAPVRPTYESGEPSAKNSGEYENTTLPSIKGTPEMNESGAVSVRNNVLGGRTSAGQLSSTLMQTGGKLPTKGDLAVSDRAHDIAGTPRVPHYTAPANDPSPIRTQFEPTVQAGSDNDADDRLAKK